MPNVLGEGLKPYVLSQIRTRQILHGSGVDKNRTPDELKALSTPTSFIRLASAVSVDEKKLNKIGLDIESNVGDGLARNNTLFSGTSKLNKNTSEFEAESFDGLETVTITNIDSFTNESKSGFLPNGEGSYELSRDYGRVPMAGIVDAQIKTLTRGSIKKATIKIKAHSREQFDIIDILYMRLGMTVCLEWGHTLYPLLESSNEEDTPGSNSQDKIIVRQMYETFITDAEKGFFSNPDPNMFNTLSDIENVRNLKSGNYDAVLGKISNFKWSYLEDGSYDISLTIVSMGDVIESLKTNLSVDLTTEGFLEEALKQLPNATESDTSSTDEKDVNILSSFLWVWKFLNRQYDTTSHALYPKDEIANISDSDFEGSGGNTRHIGNYLKTSLPNQDPNSVEVTTYKVKLYRKIQVIEEDMIWDETYYYPNYGNINNGLGKYEKTLTIGGTQFNNLGMKESGDHHDITFTGGDEGENTIVSWDGTPAWVNKYVGSKDNPNYASNASGWVKWADDQSSFAGNDFKGKLIMTYKIESKTVTKVPNNLSTLGEGDGVVIANGNGNPLSSTFKQGNADETSPGPHYYIRFGAFLDFIKENILPRINLGFSEDNYKDNPSILDIDTTLDNIMYTLPNHLSLDPRVCIIRNDNFKNQQNKTVKYYTDGNGKGGLKVFSPIEGIKIGGKNLYKNTAYIMNIYLNFDFLSSAIENNIADGKVTLFTLLKNITDNINLSLGSINNLEPVIDEEHNVVKIIEGTQIPGYINSDQLKVDLNIAGFTPENKITSVHPSSTRPTSTFVRKVNIDTSITPDLASMISIGATNNGYVKGTDATAFSKWNKGLEDRFKVQYIPGSVDSTPQKTKNENGDEVFVDEALNNYFIKYLSNKANILGTTYSENKYNGYIGNYDSSVIERNLSIVSEFYRYLIATRTQRSEGNGVCAGTLGFIPFKMGFTIDGMSGWKIYNSININTNFLPKVYGETLNFIVTAIDHKIKASDWETTIQVQVVPKSEQEHNAITDLIYEFGIAKAANLTEAEDILAQFQTAQIESNPGEPNDDPLGVESTTLGTSPSTETLAKSALKTDQSIEAIIKGGMDIINSL